MESLGLRCVTEAACGVLMSVRFMARREPSVSNTPDPGAPPVRTSPVYAEKDTPIGLRRIEVALGARGGQVK